MAKLLAQAVLHGTCDHRTQQRPPHRAVGRQMGAHKAEVAAQARRVNQARHVTTATQRYVTAY